MLVASILQKFTVFLVSLYFFYSIIIKVRASETEIHPDKNNGSVVRKSSFDETDSGNLKPESLMESPGSTNLTDTSESDSAIQKADVVEIGLGFGKNRHIKISDEETDVGCSNVERQSEATTIAADFVGITQSRQVVLTYASRQDRPRQPFFLKTSRNHLSLPKIPPPPSYYVPSSRPVQLSETPSNVQEHRSELPPLFSFGQMTLFPELFINASEWAPYPNRIPADVPPSLAQLIDCEVLFVIQKIDIFNFAQIYNLGIYIIQNKNAETVYFAYETTSSCCPCYGASSFQLHILDLYQNEVIYMNKPWGCNFFLSFPVMEVYSPPSVPLGAVIKIFSPLREEFSVVDANENKLYRITRNDPCVNMFKDFEVTYTIFDLSSEKTIVGYIRRNFTGFLRTVFTDADCYGISFPLNLNAKMKAVFLGALFLVVKKLIGGVIKWRQFVKSGEQDINKIKGNDENLKMSVHLNSANVINFLQLIGKLKNLKRTGWVLRNVEDPETVSGHMYRMSIMTFLIPESSGVDKTRCMKLSLVHDLAECIVGDLTPYCGVDTTEKHRQEEVAMKELTQMIGDSGAEIFKLYKEYEAQVTEESKFVKDLDRLDMILQAFEYEKLGDKPGKLEEFFTSTINKFHFPWTIDIVKEIYKQRNLLINKGKSLGKDL